MILSQIEKEISRKITIAFKQFVCGFDILRVQGRSYVCDVNGWSFVKNSRKYYDDASDVLMDYILTSLRPSTPRTISPRIIYEKISETEKQRRPSNCDLNDTETVSNSSGLTARDSSQSLSDGEGEGIKREELRSVIAIIRHGDRTPKQKLKVKITEPLFLNYFHEYAKSRRKGKLLLIYISNFHVLIHLLLIYICKLHWNLNTRKELKVCNIPTIPQGTYCNIKNTNQR